MIIDYLLLIIFGFGAFAGNIYQGNHMGLPLQTYTGRARKKSLQKKRVRFTDRPYTQYPEYLANVNFLDVCSDFVFNTIEHKCIRA